MKSASFVEKNRRGHLRYWKTRKHSDFPGVCYAKGGKWAARMGDTRTGQAKEAYFPGTRIGEIDAAIQYLTWMKEAELLAQE